MAQSEKMAEITLFYLSLWFHDIRRWREGKGGGAGGGEERGVIDTWNSNRMPSVGIIMRKNTKE
jgi:hypothetical protein